MDIISHALIGAAIGELGPRAMRRRHVAWSALLAAAPDLPQALLLYPYVAWVNGHGVLPWHSDWDGFRARHGWATVLWELPHSACFLALLVVPLVRRLRRPKVYAFAYASHLVIDVFTHTGEWSVAPLWPLPWRVEGFADPWRWEPWQWGASWLACAALWLVVRWLRARGAPPTRDVASAPPESDAAPDSRAS